VLLFGRYPQYNFDALEAVLTDLTKQHYDLMVIAGDLVMNGPKPAEVLACVRDLRVPTLYCNTDIEVVKADPSHPVGWWTRQQLTEDDLAYLKHLPLLSYHPSSRAISLG
jgi:protein phosphatase